MYSSTNNNQDIQPNQHQDYLNVNYELPPQYKPHRTGTTESVVYVHPTRETLYLIEQLTREVSFNRKVRIILLIVVTILSAKVYHLTIND